MSRFPVGRFGFPNHPAGHSLHSQQDPGETALDTAIREAQEEVGLDLRKDFWLMGARIELSAADPCTGRMDDRTTNGRFRGPNMVVSMFGMQNTMRGSPMI